MTLILSQAAIAAAKLHTAAETALSRDGRFTGTIALIQPDGRVSAVLPFGPDGTPPSDEFVTKAAAQRGAAGLAITGEYWIDPTPLTKKQTGLDPADLPNPSDTSRAQRDQEIITTVVVRGDTHAVRYRTSIRYTAFGTNLGHRAETHEELSMPNGEAQRLIKLLRQTEFGG